ncbi:MAG TPA: phosphotransferase [Thermoanaerobaculia bacterium]|nr:phosphotransferase [Thermoanaerobaculia bacterium]
MGERQEKFSGTKEVAERLRFDVNALERYLQNHVEGFRGNLSVEQFKGGQSNPTYLLEAGGQRYVLRRKPPGKLLPSAHAVDREYRVITALGRTDVPVPRTYCLCTDDSVIGTWFYVMEFVEGRVLWEYTLPESDPAERTAIYDALNETLAKLHSVDYLALGLEDYGKPGNYFARQIHRWSKQYRASEGSRIEAMDRLMAWLPEHIPADDETTIVHGDYRLDNSILHPTKPRVLAILDWELGTLGHPLGDFSYHCMQWELDKDRLGGLRGHDLRALGIPSLAEYKAAYCARTNRERIEHWNFYMAYNLFRIAAISQGIMGRVRDGTAASTHATEMGQRVSDMSALGWEMAQRAEG